MSKGPGRLQAAILSELKRVESFFFTDLLPEGYTRSQYSSLHRAACKLADAGEISMRYSTNDAGFNNMVGFRCKMLVCRTSADQSSDPPIDREDCKMPPRPAGKGEPYSGHWTWTQVERSSAGFKKP